MARAKAARELGSVIRNIISPKDVSRRLKNRPTNPKQSGTPGGNIPTESNKKPTSKPIDDKKGYSRGRFQKGSAPAPQNQNVSTRVEDDAADFVNKGGAGKVESRGGRMVRGTVGDGNQSSREAGKEKVKLQAIIRDKSKTKRQRDAAQAKLDKIRAADEAATETAKRKGAQTRRKTAQAKRENNPSGVTDKVAHFMQTGEPIEGFKPTPAQIRQANVNALRRREMSKKRSNAKKFAEKKGGGYMKKKMAGGGPLKAVDAKKNPGMSKLPTPVRNKMGYAKKGSSVSKAMGEDRTSVPAEYSAKAQSKKPVKKKMGGGKVYERKHGGKTVSGNDGNSIVAECYD